MVEINVVYQKVLAIANKEQRGYITPQEFNLFADQAQMDIFEQYFYDLDQRQRSDGNESDYADIVTNIEEKLSLFEQFNIPGGININGNVLLPSMYRLVSVSFDYNGNGIFNVADEVQINELNKYKNSPLASPTATCPVYCRFNNLGGPNGSIALHPIPDPIGICHLNFIKRPLQPKWTYLISPTTNSALFNSGNHVDFQLHKSEENNLVIKILQLAGISLKDYTLAQATSQKEVATIQQQKQ